MKGNIVILAGGLGKRMESQIPKVLHKLYDKPMLIHVIETATALKPEKIIIVVGKYREQITEVCKQYGYFDIEYVDQSNPQGTGHALQCCRNYFKDVSTTVLILSGDVPLIKTSTLEHMLNSTTNACIMTTVMDIPIGYGRVIIDNDGFVKIVEHKDCDNNELLCQIINAGIYVIQSDLLYKHLPFLNNNNKQQEYYLTDIVEMIKNSGIDVNIYELPQTNQSELLGVNTKKQLEELHHLASSL